MHPVFILMMRQHLAAGGEILKTEEDVATCMCIMCDTSCPRPQTVTVDHQTKNSFKNHPHWSNWCCHLCNWGGYLYSLHHSHLLYFLPLPQSTQFSLRWDWLQKHYLKCGIVYSLGCNAAASILQRTRSTLCSKDNGAILKDTLFGTRHCSMCCWENGWWMNDYVWN